MHSFVRFLFLTTALTLSACTDNAQTFSSTAATGKQPQSQSSVKATGGYYKVGTPYQVEGIWYLPKEDYTYKEIGIASWYGPDFHNGITANGELYDMHGLTAAHRTLPLPSVVKVTNMQNGRSLVLRVNDRGPFKNNRVIDVSKRAAQLLGFEAQGTTQVQVEIMPEESKKLKDELLAMSGKTVAKASVADLNANEYSAQPIEKPQSLGGIADYDSNAGYGAPLIAATAPVKESPYNDWDSDMSQAKAQKSANETPKSVPAPKPVVKTPPPVPAVKKVQPVVEKTAAPGYYVQLGAFGSLENAEKTRAKAEKFGRASILPVTVNAKTLYRVRLGPDNAKKALENMDKVTNNGFPDARLVEEKSSVSVGRRLDNAF